MEPWEMGNSNIPTEHVMNINDIYNNNKFIFLEFYLTALINLQILVVYSL